jgi:CheY-like chemotaxis protein
VLDASLVLLGRELRRRGRLRHPPPTETNSVVRPSPHLTMHAVLGQFLHVLHALPAGADQREIAIQVETRHHNAVQLSVIARPGVPAVQYGPAQVSRRLALGLAEDAGAIFMEGPSDEEEWSCSLEIPLRLEATPSTLPRRQQADRVGRVLVIDDEPLIGKLVSRILSGHDVVVAHDGSTGLARARREAWDLVLLDSNLPDLPGDVIAAELTALDPSKADGVVRMSGGVLEASNDRPVLRKPFEPQALRALLNMRLDRR